MSRRLSGSLTLALGLALVLAQPLAVHRGASPSSAAQTGTARASTQQAASSAKFGDLPLAFELNEGQDSDPTVQFLAHGGGYALALTPSQALLALTPRSATPARPNRAKLPTFASTTPPSDATASTRLGMAWLGANPHPVVTGEQPLPGTVNYFIGGDPAQWRTHIPTYQQVRLHDVYPGIDLVYYGTHGQLEYDFVVAPGADPSPIALSFSGASQVGVDLLGNLSLSLPGGAIAQQKPLVYQTAANGARTTVAGGYALSAGGRVGFRIGAYNRSLPLVIDPAYKFSTYLGGSGDNEGQAIAVDSSGNVYVTGQTDSTDFPTVNPYQSAVGSNEAGASDDAFITKFKADGSALLYSTYLGGDHTEQPNGIAVDSSGNAYITGWTQSLSFPTVNAYQASDNESLNSTSAFVSKLGAAGNILVYSTFLGGTAEDQGNGIAVDSSGSAYVTGYAGSSDFPIVNGLAGTGSAFVTKFSAAGTSLVYSTIIPGSGPSYGIALNASGNAYITGVTDDGLSTVNPLQATFGGSSDAFVSELGTAGNSLVYSTYLGGTGDEQGNDIALDAAGNIYLTGNTSSTDFPTQNPMQASGSIFITKLNAAGSALIYSTYFGGSSGYDNAYGIAIDASGNAYVTGYTDSTDFPTVNPLQGSLHDAMFGNAFVSTVNATGSALLFSTYLGGSAVIEGDNGWGGEQGYGIAVDKAGNAYVTGYTSSPDFPTANALYATQQSTFPYPQDAFVTKIYTGFVTTTGVFRPSNGVLYLKNANTTGPADITLYYGQPGDQPITGDWTGKGYKSIGIFRNGTFYLRNSNTTGYADIIVPFGASTDIPVAGDWTGKGYDSIGVFRPSTDTFLLRNSNTAGPADIVARLGISGDVPVVGDWTGQGKDTIGVFRPSNGIVYLRNSNSTGVADFNFVYGVAGDKPVVGDWDGNGTDTIGVDRGGRFLLRNSNSTGPANASFYLGVNGDDPIAGPWLLPPASSAPPATPATHHPSVPAATPTRRGGR